MKPPLKLTLMDKGTDFQSYKGLSHLLEHRHNEDAYVTLSVGNCFVMGVFDGISSHPGGEEAAAICVETVRELLPERISKMTSREALVSTLADAHRKILTRQAEEKELSQMGCTATILILNQESCQVSVVSVGDSAAFRVRSGKIQKLTIDNSFCGEAIDRGQITPKKAQEFPDGFSLTSWMGKSDVVEPELRYSVYSLIPGDEYLVSSDGLHAYVSRKKMLYVITTSSTAKEIVSRLHGEAVGHGKSKDDITILYYHYPDERSRRGRKVIWSVMFAMLLLILLFSAYCIGFKHGTRKCSSNVIQPLESVSVVVKPDSLIQDTLSIKPINIFIDENL